MCASAPPSKKHRAISHKELAMNPLRSQSADEDSVDRRTFLKVVGAAGAGLTLGIFSSQDSAQMSGPGKATGAVASGEFAPNAFLRIKPDNTVTVLVKH